MVHLHAAVLHGAESMAEFDSVKLKNGTLSWLVWEWKRYTAVTTELLTVIPVFSCTVSVTSFTYTDYFMKHGSSVWLQHCFLDIFMSNVFKVSITSTVKNNIIFTISQYSWLAQLLHFMHKWPKYSYLHIKHQTCTIYVSHNLYILLMVFQISSG